MLDDTFKQIFEVSQDGFVIVRDNLILDCNAAFVKMLDYDFKSEIINLHVLDVSAKFQADGSSSYTKSQEYLREAIESNGHRFEWLHKKKDETELHCEVTLTPLVYKDEAAIFGTVRNISKRKLLEQANQKLNNSLEEKVSLQTRELKKSIDYFQTIFNIVKEGIAILDLESNFLLVNDSYAKMTGFTKSKLYTMSCMELTKKDMLEESKKVLQEVLEKGFYMDYEKICIVENDRELPVSMDVILMPDKMQILVIAKDLTLEKKRKKEKEYQEQLLVHQSRLAQMGEMISMIAHQWRQPLGAISTTSANLALKLELNSFALDSEDSRDECKNYFLKRLANIESYIESLSTTVDDFRNFYKPNKSVESVRLDAVFSKSLNIIKSSLLSSGVEIICTSNSRENIRIHESEMMHVILNILQNAQDNFTEQNIKYPKLIINIENKSINIQDNAGGVPAAILEKIFDPYFSTKHRKNGTGLGLYMSKLIVEDHHKGKLYVQNIDDGACFTIELSKSEYGES